MKKFSFIQVVEDSTSDFHKIKQEDYLSIGDYKIVDQGKELIAGYTNDGKLVNYILSPIIIFGDHTKIFKYIDFPLALGADGAKALTVKNSLADYKYLYYYFKTLRLADAGYSRHFKFLKNVSIPLPENFDDQIRIATVLTRAEKLIAKRKESIKALDEFLKSTFLEMFGDPVRNEKGWNRDKIGKAVQVQGGYAFKSNDLLSTGIVRIVKIANVHFENLIWDDITYVPDHFLMEQDKFSLSEGDILLALTRPVIKSLDVVKTATVRKHDLPCLLNQRVARFIFNETIINKTFFLHYCYTSFFKNKVDSLCPPGLQPNISTTQIENIPLYYPPLNLQNKFSAVVDKVESLKLKFVQSLTELENLYGSLSQRAFKGELDLSRVPVKKDIEMTKSIIAGKSNIDADIEVILKQTIVSDKCIKLIREFEAFFKNKVNDDLRKQFYQQLHMTMVLLMQAIHFTESSENALLPKKLEKSFTLLNEIAEKIDYKVEISQDHFNKDDHGDVNLILSKTFLDFLDSANKITGYMQSTLVQDTVTKANKLLDPWPEEYICGKIEKDFKDKPFTIQDVLDRTKLLYEVPDHYDPYQVMLDKNRKPIGLKELFFNAIAKNNASILKLRQVYVFDPATIIKRVMLEVAS